MAKAKSFADKVAKASIDFHKHCPKCGGPINTIHLVTSEKSGHSNAWRFREKDVGVCKCNEKEVVK
jgi:hypothetical protein